MMQSETPSFLTQEHGGLTLEQASNLLPNELVNEDVLLGPLTQLCSAARYLLHKDDAGHAEIREIDFVGRLQTGQRTETPQYRLALRQRSGRSVRVK